LTGRAITFMAKWTMADVGSSCHVHVSLWDSSGEDSLTSGPSDADGLSQPYRWFLGGVLATARELAWLSAPYVNSYKRYQPDSWAPTAVVWGDDNRTCGLRMVGRGPARRIESRIPGADANPYLAFSALIAGGLHGIEHHIDPPAPFRGNAYTAEDVERVPPTLVEAIDALEHSAVAVDAFGADVHAHLLNTARQEWAAFNRTVTDWELQRNFERI
jgi:glutamine synthetase